MALPKSHRAAAIVLTQFPTADGIAASAIRDNPMCPSPLTMRHLGSRVRALSVSPRAQNSHCSLCFESAGGIGISTVDKSWTSQGWRECQKMNFL
jgi:hypothetical protein